MKITIVIVFLLLFAIGLVLVSLVLEAARPAVSAPEKLAWAPNIPIQYQTVHGHRLRYIRTGEGPPLLLLHTLRTQLDIFQKIIPSLAARFTVYALDYPGHGYSDIPKADYEPKLFVDAVAGFLDTLDIRDATLAGVSIGGTIPLLLAAQRNPRVEKIVAINPYDYAKGLGVRRASFVANLVCGLALVPVVGETVMRLRNRLVEKAIFNGGVAEPSAIPPQLMEEFFLTGLRPGHYKAFLSLLRNAHKWEDAQAHYQDIKVPVLLVYGERDWSRPKERKATQQHIPGSRIETVAGGSHFLSLDRPRELERLIRGHAGVSPPTAARFGTS
jgi:pimeloyl-ACP methyl ester carboxylesterase